MTPEISIIIPCYNSGVVLLEALQSIENCNDQVIYEIIIIDDGSNDLKTKNILNKLKDTHPILFQENKGPAAARNLGIKNSKAPFLLFLDSDNKLLTGYLDKAIKLFKNDAEIGVIYSNVSFFGETTKPRFEPDIYNYEKLLAHNYIDMCAIIRKKVWEEVGGLDESRKLIGREDWDFWLSIGKTNWKFHFIDEKFYEYRINKKSLINTIEEQTSSTKVREYIYAKHINSLSSLYPKNYLQSQFYLKDQQRPFRSFFKFIFINLKKRLS